MIRDSNKKLFEIVLVWKFDRFARNRFDSANYKMILKKNNVHLISVMEPIAEGSQGILVETLLEGMAEYYSAELSEKVIRGQTENALKGKCTGGTGTIGYKIDNNDEVELRDAKGIWGQGTRRAQQMLADNAGIKRTILRVSTSLLGICCDYFASRSLEAVCKIAPCQIRRNEHLVSAAVENGQIGMA